MSRDPKYIDHSLDIHLAEKVVADEVSAEAGIDIEFKEALWFAPANPAKDMVGVYCKTYSDAIWFEHAFGRRRWEDSKSPQGE
jgi:hypothetical protein